MTTWYLSDIHSLLQVITCFTWEATLPRIQFIFNEMQAALARSAVWVAPTFRTKAWWVKKMHKLWALYANLWFMNHTISKRIKLQACWLSRSGFITELFLWLPHRGDILLKWLNDKESDPLFIWKRPDTFLNFWHRSICSLVAGLFSFLFSVSY